MNPDQPQAPAQNPMPEVSVTPVVEPTPAPVESVTPVTPNPFGGAPVSSEPVAAAAPFAQPVGTIGSSPNNNPVPNFLGDPKKKKLIILIAAIVGGLVVLGIIALVVINLLFPSKADYRDAASQFNAVSSAYSDLNSNASKLQYDVSGSTTDTEFTNDSDSVTKSLQTFQDANKKLAGMKAVKVGDGQKLYTTYEGKVTAFGTYATDLLTSLKSFRPVAKACADVSTSTLLGECVTALNGVGTIPNADLKQFVTVLQTQYKAYQSVKTQIDAIKDPYGDQYTQYSALRNQGYDIQDKISSASSDFSSNATKHASDIDPATAANALGDFLVKQSNG
jgi:cytochrome c556